MVPKKERFVLNDGAMRWCPQSEIKLQKFLNYQNLIKVLKMNLREKITVKKMGKNPVGGCFDKSGGPGIVAMHHLSLRLFCNGEVSALPCFITRLSGHSFFAIFFFYFCDASHFKSQ